MKERILEIIARILETEVSELDCNKKVEEIKNWDSLAHVLIVAAVEEELHIHIPLDKIVEITTIQELIDIANEDEK